MYTFVCILYRKIDIKNRVTRKSEIDVEKGLPTL